MPVDPVAERFQGVLLAGVPGALDELHDADSPAAAEGAQHQPPGRRRLALARAGMDDQQPLLDGLLRDLGVLHGFALGHLLAVTIVVGHEGFPGFSDEGFTVIGSPATMKTTRSDCAASR
ncbi:hypothetical protein MMMDOFMJ_2078 [Methylobacterium gnaphalii]|nr:hypothetical protein MMMDOFMJ_2078 [Methylobacterium gnaphalii]